MGGGRLRSTRFRRGAAGAATPAPAQSGPSVSSAPTGLTRERAGGPGAPPPGRLRLTIDETGRLVDRSDTEGMIAAGSSLVALLPVRLNSPVVPQVARVDPDLAEGLARALAVDGSVVIEAAVERDGAPAALVRLELGAPTPSGYRTLDLDASRPLDGATLVKRARRLERLSSLPTALATALDLDRDLRQRVQRFLEILTAATDMETGALFGVRSERRAELVAAFGKTSRRGFPYPELSLADAPPAHVMKHRRLHLARSDTQLPAALEAVTTRGAGTVVLVPAESEGRVEGILVLSRREQGPMTLDAVDLLSTAAHMVGLLLRNQALSTETRQSEAVLETAYAVSRAISHSLDVEQTYNQIAQNAARIVGGSHCLLLESEPESDDLVVVAWSEPEDAVLQGLRVRFEDLDDSLGSRAERRSVVVEDLVWGARVGSDLRRRLEMQSALFLPMMAQGVLVGSLVIYSTGRRRSYAREEVARAEDVAEQAAIAIHNARLYRDLTGSQERVAALLSRIAQIREHERRVFARLVHDDIVQSIVGAIYRLQAVRDTVPEPGLAEFDSTVDVLRGAIKDARDIIWELRPPVLEELGLAEALRGLAGRVDREGSTRVDVTLEGVEHVAALGDGVSTALYKIAREALLNARRHGAARHVHIELGGDRPDNGGLVRLRVTDDGSGFDVETSRVTDHYGLVMMEEQAAVVGGALTIHSAPGEGTTVEVAIRLERGAR